MDHETTIGELLRSAEEAGVEVVDVAGRREDGTPEWLVTAVRGERVAEFLEMVEWFLDDQRPTLSEQELLLKAFLLRWSGSTLFSARELELAVRKPLPIIERDKSGSLFCWFERRTEDGRE